MRKIRKGLILGLMIITMFFMGCSSKGVVKNEVYSQVIDNQIINFYHDQESNSIYFSNNNMVEYGQFKILGGMKTGGNEFIYCDSFSEYSFYYSNEKVKPIDKFEWKENNGEINVASIYSFKSNIDYSVIYGQSTNAELPISITTYKPLAQKYGTENMLELDYGKFMSYIASLEKSEVSSEPIDYFKNTYSNVTFLFSDAYFDKENMKIVENQITYELCLSDNCYGNLYVSSRMETMEMYKCNESEIELFNELVGYEKN